MVWCGVVLYTRACSSRCLQKLSGRCYPGTESSAERGHVAVLSKHSYQNSTRCPNFTKGEALRLTGIQCAIAVLHLIRLIQARVLQHHEHGMFGGKQQPAAEETLGKQLFALLLQCYNKCLSLRHSVAGLHAFRFPSFPSWLLYDGASYILLLQFPVLHSYSSSLLPQQTALLCSWGYAASSVWSLWSSLNIQVKISFSRVELPTRFNTTKLPL